MTNENHNSFQTRYQDAQRQALPGSYEHVQTGRIVQFLGISVDGATLQPSVLYCEQDNPTITFHSPIETWTAKIELDGQMVEKFRYLGFIASLE